MGNNENVIMLSGLQHYAYCPRQFALIHIEQAWEENQYTAEGHALHERVDNGATELRSGVRYERGVLVHSQQYQLTGKLDMLEIEQGEMPVYFPVEYKRGRPKAEVWDHIQLCAQALCIEEMRGVRINEGAVWYWQVRKRQSVRIDTALRAQTIAAIEGVQTMLALGNTPSPIKDKKRCRACSLAGLCEPDVFRFDQSAAYIRLLFAE